MKYSGHLLILCSFAFLAACTKDDDVTGTDGIVKSIDSVFMDTQIGLIPLEGNTFVIVSNGNLIKLDDQGRIYWKKPITEILYPHAAVVEPGAGFVLFGVPANPPTPSSFFACRYDADGNLLETKQVNINFPDIYAQVPVSMIRLANGGFAIVMPSSYSWFSFLKILDHDFNLVYSRAFSPPAGYDEFLVQHICEMPEGDMAMTALVGHTNFNNAWINEAIILTGPDGIIKSLDIRGDSIVNQLANAVSPYAGGFFVASSTKTGWLSENGAFVNYYDGTQIAGALQIDRFNPDGQFTGSRKLTGYEGYGVIKSIRKTSDGGYLLCGTTGNNGSSGSVSMTKIYVCKLDASLNEQWSRVINTSYQAIGADAVTTDGGGCLVTGNQKSFNNEYQMLMIRTDANGAY